MSTVEVFVNGEPRRVGAQTTVDRLVDIVAGGRAGIAVAINAELVPRSAWERTELQGGERVEILVAAQGG